MFWRVDGMFLKLKLLVIVTLQVRHTKVSYIFSNEILKLSSHNDFVNFRSLLLVAGLPNPQSNHAEVMTRFAHDLLKKMTQRTSELEKTLGPGTSSLQMRIGVSFHVCLIDSIHILIQNSNMFWLTPCRFYFYIKINSGPTTAGVLRGSKSRFQLFGDVRATFTSKSIGFQFVMC